MFLLPESGTKAVSKSGNAVSGAWLMVMSRIRQALSMPSLSMADPPPDWQEDPIALYKLLRAYYYSSDLYSSVQRLAVTNGVWTPAMKALRNPAHRVVEFYVSHLWPDEFKLVAEDETLAEPIAQVWKWSNWEAKRRLAARWFPMLGDLFIKVVQPTGQQRVYFQLVDPEYVLDFDTDARGFVTYLHMEVPKVVRKGDETTNMIHTEIWDAEAGTYRRWERDRYLNVEQLGAPIETRRLTEFGIDFVPFVHAMFQDVGNPRGVGAYTHALDKLDEANMQATNLHSMFFQDADALWVLQANGMDATGRPLPPPRIEGAAGSSSDNGGAVQIGKRSVVRLPGMSTLVPTVPNINYAAGLEILNAQLRELQDDLPELTFFRLHDEGELSGRAIRMKMTAGIDKILEARGNALQALIRANQMALTLGKAAGLDGFQGVGNFDDGALDHSYEPREPIAISEEERWDTEKAKAEAAVLQQESGVSVQQTLRDRDYTVEEIATMQLERDDEQQNAGQRILADFDRGVA